MAATASPKDPHAPGTAVHFIDMKKPGCPLYEGTIVSVDKENKTAVIRAVSRYIHDTKDEVTLTVPLDKLHSSSR